MKTVPHDKKEKKQPKKEGQYIFPL